MAKPTKKKVSIREFVSENGIKFQLYLLKYANQLKDIEEKTKEEIEKKWEYDTQKKINRFKNDLEKPQYKDAIPQNAILSNIEYVKNLPAPTDKDAILKEFENVRNDYIQYLIERIEANETATLNEDKKLLEYARNVELTPNVSKEKFGQMLLLMIKNLATMPSFSGYSENWKTDFFSNAIEKTLLYLNNFDEKLLSKRTGERSKAFAYVTQICFNAFVNIINIRKKEDAFLKDTISLETANLDGMKNYMAYNDASVSEEITKEEEQRKKEYSINIKKLEELDGTIRTGVQYILDSNNIIRNNKNNIEEIRHLEESTPQEEKNSDYEDYIKDLKDKIIPELEENVKDTLRIIKPDNLSLGDWENTNDMKGISLIISGKPSKNKGKKKVKKKEPEPELIDIDDSFDEW